MSPSSLKSARSNNSSASQRRILEARAAKELAKIDLRKLEVERTLVEARLAEETALLEEDAASHVSAVSEAVKSVQVHKWVDETYNAEREVNVDYKQERGHQDYRTAVNDYRSGYDNDIVNLTRAITEAINKTTTTNTTPTTDKLLGRMSAKDLPTFTGDPIEWLRFKNVYQSTTRIGQYSDEENVARLQRCLHGPAWEAVAARLITVTSADEIIKTLEMRFGRPDLVLHRLISEVRKIPKLTGARTDLVSLATKVDNCVAAIESMDHIGYLYSPDLMTMIIDKMTEPIFFRWLDYSKGLTTRDPQLPALAKYLMKEAHEVCLRGALESAQTKTTGTKRSILLTNVGEDESHPEPDKESTNVVVPKTTCEAPTEKKCAFCSDKGHGITTCPKFADEDINQRWDWTCKHRLCFRCLKSTHRRERCKYKVRCKTCKRGHHSLLHRLDWDKPETTANTWSVKNKVFLKVLPVEIEGPSGSVTTYALLDEGSTISLIESDIAEKIGATGPEKELKIHGVVGLTSSASSQMVTLTIRTPWGLHQLDRVRTVKALNLPYHTIPKEYIESFDHLKDLPLYAFEGQPAMLIGQDQWPLIVSRELREGGKDEPVASLTKLGWVLHGVCSSIASNIMPEFALHARLDEDDRLDELVKNYFHLDSLGVKCLDRPRLSPDEKRAIHILDTKSRKIGKRWETGLIWRSDDVQLPDNRRNAEHRLRCTERMMDADPIAAADYEKQVVNFIEKGYAKEAQEKPTGRVWYLPHFGVRNPNKPGKLRLVFDAKATTNGISLNTELLTGPDLLNNLLGVLLRFRERAVAVTADIREMFLQVKINADDQNAQCFLWRGMERKQPPRTYKMTSMTFGATSSPCTATYIIRRNADEYASSHPRAVEAIKKRHYVDDYLDSLDDEEEMKRLVEDVVMIHKTGGFDIRGWASNRPNVLPKENLSCYSDEMMKSKEPWA